MERYKKGDIVTYSNGMTKCINKPDRYARYFDNNYYNSAYDLTIMKIQRFKKILWFYMLVTVYERRSD